MDLLRRQLIGEFGGRYLDDFVMKRGCDIETGPSKCFVRWESEEDEADHEHYEDDEVKHDDREDREEGELGGGAISWTRTGPP